MSPDLELVQIGRGQPFAARSHGYPCHAVRWHVPECEIHQAAATSGRYVVGDLIGEFAPGHLVRTGPTPPRTGSATCPRAARCRCGATWSSSRDPSDAAAVFPELAALSPRLRLSRRGALFGPRRSAAAAPSFDELAGARGVRRVELFAGPLSRDRGARPPASAGYLPDPPGLRPAGINAAPAFIDDHLTEPFTEGDLAAIAGRSPSSFSRAFHRHTGMALVQDVDRLRVDLACHEPMIDEPGSTTDIRFAAGFNLGDFKRRILAPKGMPSPQVRALLAENARARAAEATAAGGPPAPGAARAQRHHHRPRRSWACCGSTTVGRPARAPGAPARPPGHHGLHRPALRPAARALRAEPLHAERPVLRPGPAPGRDDAPGGPPRAGAGSPPTIRPACSRSSWPRSWP